MVCHHCRVFNSRESKSEMLYYYSKECCNKILGNFCNFQFSNFLIFLFSSPKRSRSEKLGLQNRDIGVFINFEMNIVQFVLVLL